MKKLIVFAVAAIMMTACQKETFNDIENTPLTFTPGSGQTVPMKTVTKDIFITPDQWQKVTPTNNPVEYRYNVGNAIVEAHIYHDGEWHAMPYTCGDRKIDTYAHGYLVMKNAYWLIDARQPDETYLVRVKVVKGL